MKNEQNNNGGGQQGNSKENEEKQHPIPQHNPFEPGGDKQITQEDLDNEQKYKEAMTERD